MVQQHDIVWRSRLPYEVRSLLKTTQGEEEFVICGDKSGTLTCLDTRGASQWTDTQSARTGGGPPYALHVVDAPQDKDGSETAVVIVGTGRGILRCKSARDGRSLKVHSASGLADHIAFPKAITAGVGLRSRAAFWLGFGNGDIVLYRLTFSHGGVGITPAFESTCGDHVVALGHLSDARRHMVVIAGTALGQLAIVRSSHHNGTPATTIPLTTQGAVRTLSHLGSLSDRSEIVAVSLDDGLAVLIVHKGRVAHPSWISLGSRVNCVTATVIDDRIWLLAGTRAGFVHLFQGPLQSELKASRADTARSWLTRLLARPTISIPFEASVLRLVPLASHGHELRLCVGLGNHDVQGVDIKHPDAFRRSLLDEHQPRLAAPAGTIVPGDAPPAPIDLEHIASQLLSSTSTGDAGQRLYALLFRTEWLSDYVASRWTDKDRAALEMIVFIFLEQASHARAIEISQRLVELGRAYPAISATTVTLTQHIDKYWFDGDTFSVKTTQLDELAESNERAGGAYLYDAAIYRQLIAERRCVLSSGYRFDSQVTQVATAMTPRGRLAFAIAYSTGEFAVFDGMGIPLKTVGGEGPSERMAWIQQVLVYGEPDEHWMWLVAFYRDRGWSASRLQRGTASEADRDTVSQLTNPDKSLLNERLAYVYSSVYMGGGRFVLGGRFGDLFLIRIEAGDGPLTITPLDHKDLLGVDPASYSPVWSLAKFGDGTIDVIAGFSTGDSYKVAINGDKFGEATHLYRSAAAVRAIAVDNANRVVVGDTLGNVALLQPLGGDAEGWGVAWGIQLPAAVEGIASFQWRPRTLPRDADRPMLAVSDSMGSIHLLRTDLLSHTYAVKVCIGSGVGPLTLLNDARTATPEPEILAGGADGHVRTIRLEHRRDSLARALVDIATLTVQRAALHTILSPEEIDDIRREISEALEHADAFLSETLGAIERRHASAAPLLRPALEHVAWRLASCVPGKAIPQALVARLQFDDPAALPALTAELRQLTRQSANLDRHRLRALLRIAFKIASRVATPDPSPEDRAAIVNLIATVNQLSDVWGTHDSDDNLICRLYIIKYLCRYATAASLALFFSHTLDGDLDDLKTRTMSQFVSLRLLTDLRISGRRRTLQYIRRMVLRDSPRELKPAVESFIIGLLVERVQAQEASQEGWLGLEFFLCFHAIHTHYHIPFLEILEKLMEPKCSRSTMRFIASCYGVRPPDDTVAAAVAKGLSLVQVVTEESTGAAACREALFNVLREKVSRDGDDQRAIPPWCLNVGVAAAVGIEFGRSHSEDVQRQAHKFLQDLSRRPLLETAAEKTIVALQCAASLMRRAASEADQRREIREARQRLSRYLLEPSLVYVDDSADDIVASALDDALVCVKRRLDIEADFVTPVHYLRRFDSSGESSWREQHFADELREYLGFLCQIGTATRGLSVTIPSKKHFMVIDEVTRDGRERFNEPREEAIDRIRRFFGEGVTALEAVVPTTGSRSGKSKRYDVDEPVLLQNGRLLEIVQLDEGGREGSGLLAFEYDAHRVLDPARRAVVRIIPQVIISEFRRASQARQVLSLTFHHINAPIAAARMMVSDLRAGYIDAEQQKDHLDQMFRVLEDCRMMIALHQNFVRVMRGIGPPLNVSKFDAIGELEFRRRMIGLRYKASRHTLRLNTDSTSVIVTLDKVLFGDIVQNLLDNACKYSPAGSEVVIEARTSRRDLFVSIRDTGPGLPSGVWTSMFAEGARGPLALSKEGLGLGLFMVSEYVRILGGEVWYDSAPTGTTFTVKVPLRMETVR